MFGFVKARLIMLVAAIEVLTGLMKNMENRIKYLLLSRLFCLNINENLPDELYICKFFIPGLSIYLTLIK